MRESVVGTALDPTGSGKKPQLLREVTDLSARNRAKAVLDAGDSSHDRELTQSLAAKVMGWRIARGRYLKAQRSWIPAWRFLPLTRLEDAFQLLNRASGDYKLTAVEGLAFSAEVRVGDRTGIASGEPKARVIALAVGRAVGLALPGSVPADQPLSKSRSRIDAV